MNPGPTSVTSRIHEALRSGKTEAEVLQDLVSSGLSAPSAERLLARALSESSTLRGAKAPTPAPKAPAGGPPLSLQSISRAGAGLLFAGLLFAGAVSWQRDSRRSARLAFEEGRLAAIQDAEANRRAVERESALQKAIALEKESSRVAGIARARLNVQNSSHHIIVCDSMLLLGREQATEAIPDLLAILERPTASASLRGCAAEVLITFGETARPIEFFKECLRVGTLDARQIAILGFQKIGPPAAALAIPVLREELQSPNAFLRRTAVRALGALGPEATPLLNQATRDPDTEVRDLAKQTLSRK